MKLSKHEQREYETAIRRMNKTARLGPDAESDPEEYDEAPQYPVIGLRVLPDGPDCLLDRYLVGARASRALVIGSSPDAHIRISDPAVSARHCLITRFRSHVYAFDAGSTNGLLVNSQRALGREIFEGFTLTMGKTTLLAISARTREQRVISGRTHRSFLQNALHVYGSLQKAARGIRVPYTTYRKWLRGPARASRPEASEPGSHEPTTNQPSGDR